jgi:hypothetical protein
MLKMYRALFNILHSTFDIQNCFPIFAGPRVRTGCLFSLQKAVNKTIWLPGARWQNN